MNVAMMQPSFMPWQGYFELIYQSERFIFLDDFQFSVQSYHQRNRLFINKGQVGWYSIPVQKANSFKAPLNLTKIDDSVPWRKKMWKRIEQNYSRTPFYKDSAPYVEKWLSTPAESLAEINISFIKFMCDFLGFKREFYLSSHYPFEHKRSMRVLELLQWCEADYYFCAKGSFEYMREEGVFPVDRVTVLFQDFKPEIYNQVGSSNSFITSLSILDAVMNVGADSTAKLIKNGTRKWLTWEDMLSINDLANGVECYEDTCRR